MIFAKLVGIAYRHIDWVHTSPHDARVVERATVAHKYYVNSGFEK